MNITKTFLANIPDICCSRNLHDKNYILFASEGDDVCLAYSLPDLQKHLLFGTSRRNYGYGTDTK